MMETRILSASPYFWEKVKGKNLARRHSEGKLSFMLLNQPPLCDAHCKRCFMPTERRALGTSKDVLGLLEWFSLIEKGKERGLLSIEISGEGEPLLSESTLPIIRHANSLGILATLITNGHALTEEAIQALLEEGATLIFSLHTLSKRKYEEDNCLAESFERKMAAIEKAAVIFGRSSYRESRYLVQRLAIHCTLQADNLDEVEEIKRFAGERGIFFSIAPLANSGNAVLHPELRVAKEIIDVTSMGDNSIIHSITSAEIYGREVCGTAAFGMSIGFNGDLLLDAHGGYEIGDSLGNVRRDSFERLHGTWKSTTSRMFQAIEGFCPVRDPGRFEKLIQKLKTEKCST